MVQPIEDYTSSVPAALRLGRLLRRPARHARARPLARCARRSAGGRGHLGGALTSAARPKTSFATKVPGNTLDIAERRAHLQWLFELFPILESRQAQVARTLSGAEQQMLALARALMMKPRCGLLWNDPGWKEYRSCFVDIPKLGIEMKTGTRRWLFSFPSLAEWTGLE
jgi:ABC-type dipeptide/oligopeptide/nickel transport system ATPase subunit